jgi:hypothetical protein
MCASDNYRQENTIHEENRAARGRKKAATPLAAGD